MEVEFPTFRNDIEVRYMSDGRDSCRVDEKGTLLAFWDNVLDYMYMERQLPE